MGANTSKDEHSHSIYNKELNHVTDTSNIGRYDDQVRLPTNLRVKALVSPRYEDGVITPKTLMNRSVYPSLKSPNTAKSALVSQIPSTVTSKRQSTVKEAS